MTTTKIMCPIEGCDVEGSIPGVKRHARKKHALTSYEAFEGLGTSDEEDITTLKLAELKALAAERNVELPSKITKAELLQLLSA